MILHHLYDCLRCRYYLLGPIHELELPDRPGGSVTSVCDFELSQQVLGHIVLSQWVNHKTLENIQFLK